MPDEFLSMNWPGEGRWSCDHCGGPLVGGVFYPRVGGQRWCEDCTVDDAADFVDHRTFTAQFLDDRSSSGAAEQAHVLQPSDSAASLAGCAVADEADDELDEDSTLCPDCAEETGDGSRCPSCAQLDREAEYADRKYDDQRLGLW